MLNKRTKNICEVRQMRASQIIGVRLVLKMLIGMLIVTVSAPSWATMRAMQVILL